MKMYRNPVIWFCPKKPGAVNNLAFLSQMFRRMLLSYNYNWFLGSFVVAVVAADSQNHGRGKSSSTVVLLKCQWLFLCQRSSGGSRVGAENSNRMPFKAKQRGRSPRSAILPSKRNPA
jgi:hypothetical protein